ncbi:hypothetical protein [Leifsonia poae]|uniref:hypothetical protein n=1 Tax=Leifsonia poae TaxID=110933 RepID=UPI003D66865C
MRKGNPPAENRVGGWSQGAAYALAAIFTLIGALLSIVIIFQLMNIAACSGLAAECDFATLYAAIWITPATTLLVLVGVIVVLRTRRKQMRSLWWVSCLGGLATLTAYAIAASLITGAIHP